MPNVNKPAGLAAVQYLNGAPWSGQARTYFIPMSDTNSYSIGDPVALAAAGGDGNGVPGVTLATAGASDPIVGAVVGCGRYEWLMADPSNLDQIIIPATKLHPYYVMVVDDQNVIFGIQEGGTGPALTAANIGENVNLLAGANNGFLSGFQFDNTTAAVGATGQLRLMGLVRTPDNAFGPFAKWLVKINTHQYAPNSAGA